MGAEVGSRYRQNGALQSCLSLDALSESEKVVCMDGASDTTPGGTRSIGIVDDR